MYRQLGISLDDIKDLISAPDNMIKEVLEKRLHTLNCEIQTIKKQQNTILNILKSDRLIERLKVFDKETLIRIFELIGFVDKDMDRLHAKLEEKSPEGHQAFLEALGIGSKEIEKIRKYAKSLNQNTTKL
jgi:DNA-binding transcriptional MerR regulator